MRVLVIDPFIVYTPTQHPQPTPHRYRASRFESKQTPTGIVNHIAENLKINITRTAPDALHLRESFKQGTLVSIPLGHLTTSTINNALSQYHKVLSSSPLTTFNLSHPTNHPSVTSSGTLSTAYGKTEQTELYDLSYLARRHYLTSLTHITFFRVIRLHLLSFTFTDKRGIAERIANLCEPMVVKVHEEWEGCDSTMKFIEEACGELWGERMKGFDVNKVKRRIRSTLSSLQTSIATCQISSDLLTFECESITETWCLKGTVGRGDKGENVVYCLAVTFKKKDEIVDTLKSRCEVLCTKFGLKVALEFLSDFEVYDGLVGAGLKLRQLKERFCLKYVKEDVREEEEGVVVEFGVWGEKVEVWGEREGVRVEVDGEDIKYTWKNDVEDLISSVKTYLVNNRLKFLASNISSNVISVDNVNGQLSISCFMIYKSDKYSVTVGHVRVNRETGRLFSEEGGIDKVCNCLNDFFEEGGGGGGKFGEGG
ncbi:hypothetical protein TL16_g10867 [Triparma laevis f. inornata]|uniref:Uncharacterized protein n=1 Tax=Triparma laevis f. inornata TaxID=1714386 RepID=A0A9W7ENS5_9STRA|nr:hypothetical protein TL16_g10867 [Triparma laevis f. inornata]